MFTEYLDAHPLLPLLLPKDRRIAIPRASDRDAWRALPEETLSQIARAAQEARDQAYPPADRHAVSGLCAKRQPGRV